jgi:surface protein
VGDSASLPIITAPPYILIDSSFTLTYTNNNQYMPMGTYILQYDGTNISDSVSVTDTNTSSIDLTNTQISSLGDLTINLYLDSALFDIINVFTVNYLPIVLTYNVPSDNTLVTVPISGTYTSLIVDWGIGGREIVSVSGSSITNTYAVAGTYTVYVTNIDGAITHLGDSNIQQTLCTSCESFGTVGLTDLSYAFYGASNLTGVPTTLLSAVTDMSYMFSGAASFNQDLTTWVTSGVTNMSHMFTGATIFNGDISGWDTSAVTDMSHMFDGALAFNQNINTSSNNAPNVRRLRMRAAPNVGAFRALAATISWSVVNVINMSNMFANAISFNQPITNWNTASVVILSGMFANAISFNQPVSNLDVSNVIVMTDMFAGAETFNQPLTNWITSNVTDMSNMFTGASSFNQNTSNLDISNVTSPIVLAPNTSPEIYNATLIGWASKNNVGFSKFIDAANLKYSTFIALAARTSLTTTYNWTIVGDTAALPVYYLDLKDYAISPPAVLVSTPFTMTYINRTVPIPIGTYTLQYLTNTVSTGTPPTVSNNTTSRFAILAQLDTSGLLSVDIYNGSTLFDTISINVHTVCFGENTNILTNKGYVSIKNLRKGDLVKTYKHGFIPVSMIGYSKIYNPENDMRIKNRLYKYNKEECPELTEDLILTGGHSVLVNTLTPKQLEKCNTYRNNKEMIDGKYLLLACADEKAEPYTKTGIHTVYNLALETRKDMNYGIYANGLLVEACTKKYMRQSSGMIIIE